MIVYKYNKQKKKFTENGHTMFEDDVLKRLKRLSYLEEQIKQCQLLPVQRVINWVAFDWMKVETRPTECDKYLVTRKDGKIHWETWNGNGWAYNHNEIRYWAEITPPYELFID